MAEPGTEICGRPERSSRGFNTGIVQVYMGEGKGKTTAALGLALRAAGHRFKVMVVQFMKGASFVGELFAAERLYPELVIHQFGRDCRHSSSVRQGVSDCGSCRECFVELGKETAEDHYLAKEAMNCAREAVFGGGYDIVILDEIGNAARHKLVNVRDLLDLVAGKPPNVELVLTGRYMPKEILDKANLVTEMVAVKHPHEEGIQGRRGIEY